MLDQSDLQSAELPGSKPMTIWDENNPRLQRYWDSTAMKNLLGCPYRYYLNNVQGWQTIGQKIDLEFGRIAGEGLELFYKGIIEDGLAHEEALRRALRHVMELSWDTATNSPRLGSYERVWACAGETIYKNEKGNRAKCPFAFKGKFWAAPGPETCGVCGSTTRSWDHWIPANPVKDRYQLVRLIVWYAEEVKNGHLKPLSWQEIENGPHRALVEVPWNLPLFEQEGKVYWLCGWFDAVKALGSLTSEAFVTDYKTTKHTLGPSFFKPFAPDLQVNIYDLAAATLFRDVLPYRGVAIEGIQTLTGGVRFALQGFRKTEEQRAALVRELQVWLRQAIEYARAGYWPKNRANCYLCQFKEICALPDSSHETMLAAKFTRARWNPLTRTQETVTDERRASKREPTIPGPDRGVPGSGQDGGTSGPGECEVQDKDH